MSTTGIAPNVREPNPHNDPNNGDADREQLDYKHGGDADHKQVSMLPVAAGASGTTGTGAGAGMPRSSHAVSEEGSAEYSAGLARSIARRVRQTESAEARAVKRHNWKRILDQHQRLYDRRWPRQRVLKRFWRLVLPVRQDLDSRGVEQGCLNWNRHALDVQGVIYAIVCLKSGHLYVGQTINSCFERFKQHCRTKDKTNLHSAIQQFGVNQFRVFPIEKIDPNCYDWGRRKDKLARFRKAATVRERFWIERFCSFQPHGFNKTWSARTRHRPRKHSEHAHRNPMKWRRQLNREGGQTGLKRLALEHGSVQLVAAPVPAAGEQLEDSDGDADEKQGGQRMAADQLLYGGRCYAFRDYRRRLNFLARMFSEDRLNQVDLDRYKRPVLMRVYYLLQHGKLDIAVDAAKAITELIRGFLWSRERQGKKVKPHGALIRVEWKSRLLRAVGLKRILMQPDIQQLLPESARLFTSDVLVVRKLGETLGRKVLNFSSVARRMDAPALSADCPCRRLFSRAFRPNGGCVLTGDLNIICDRELRRLLEYGLRFRARCDADPVHALRSALQVFAEQMNESCHLSAQVSRRWVDAVLAKCRLALSWDKLRGVAEGGVQMSHKAAKYLSFLKKYLVFVPVDKAAGNVALVYKALYVDRLRTELSADGSAYSTHDESVEEIIQRHRIQLAASHIEVGEHTKLPYLYWLPKMHKYPVGARFIAGSSDCSTTECSKMLSDVLNFVLNARREEDNLMLRRTGVRRFFVISGYEEVADFLGRWPRVAATKHSTYTRQLSAGDFSTMYTTIPHDDLVARVRQVCREAFGFIARTKFSPAFDADDVVAEWSPHGVKWSRAGEENAVRSSLSCNEVGDLVQFLVSNTFLVNGQQQGVPVVRRQRIGIPMGTNAAPALANIYLHSYECDFIDRLARETPERARAFHMTFRLIDDLLSVDNRYWRQYSQLAAEDGGIYPKALLLNSTQISDREVKFVGMHITDSESGALRVRVFDKRLEFPFHVQRYPHMDSVIPQSIPYGVFTGQLHRYYRICTEAADFIEQACSLGRILHAQGCAKKKLYSRFHDFMSTRRHIRYKSAVSVLVKQFVRGMGNVKQFVRGMGNSM
jgi:hypothetical protein